MSPRLRPSTLLLRAQPDARLAAMAASGYQDAFSALSERYRAELLRFVRRTVPEARAEDIVQETFLRAWNALSKGASVPHPRAWLYRIARNAALDGVAKHGYDYEQLSEAVTAPDDVEKEVERRRITRATLTGLAGLPDSQRRALLESAVGRSRAEIAADLGISEGAVRQLVHRGRASLRKAVAAFVPVPLLMRMLQSSGGASPVQGHVVEVSAGAGAAGGSILLGKGAAIVAAIAAGTVALAPAITPRSDGAAHVQGAPAHVAAHPGRHGGRSPQSAPSEQLVAQRLRAVRSRAKAAARRPVPHASPRNSPSFRVRAAAPRRSHRPAADDPAAEDPAERHEGSLTDAQPQPDEQNGEPLSEDSTSSGSDATTDSRDTTSVSSSTTVPEGDVSPDSVEDPAPGE